jgi:hypothetical protein
MKVYEKWYKGKYPKRGLNWVHTKGFWKLSAKIGEKTYEFEMNTL